MRLIITEHILFGLLRPWIKDLSRFKFRDPITEPPATLADFEHGLENYPQVYNELAAGWKTDPEAIEQLTIFVETDIKAPVNHRSSYYRQLIQGEQRWFLAQLTAKISELEQRADQLYEVNKAFRYLEDVLNSCIDLVEEKEDGEVKYILTQVADYLILTILDLSLRYEDLNDFAGYDEQRLFTEVLDGRVTGSGPFVKTTAYWEYKLQQLVGDEEPVSAYVDLYEGVLLECRKGFNSDQQQFSVSNRGLETFILHLQNVLFLLVTEASFLGDRPAQLLDVEYCREWVQGMRGNLLSQEDPQRATLQFRELLEAAEDIKQWLGLERWTMPKGRSRRSEAWQLLDKIEKIYGNQLQEGSSGVSWSSSTTDGGGGKAELDFVESFNRRFVRFDTFDSVFPGSREATMRYVQKGDIRVLEISRELKFLYREDVEDFLDESTDGGD
jgi:hypothetical protein